MLNRIDSVEQPGVCLAPGTRLVQRSPLSPRLVDQDVGPRQILSGTPTSSGYRQDPKGPSQASQSPEPWTGPVGSSCCLVVE